MEIGIGTFGGCFINTSRKIFPMMFRIVESSFVEIGIGTFGGCFRTPLWKVFLMMSRNGGSSFVEIGIGTFGGCFINMGDEPRKVFPMMSQNEESSL